MFRAVNIFRVSTARYVEVRGTSCKKVITENVKPMTTPLRTQFTIKLPTYGGRYLVSMITGVGVGPELMNHVRDIFDYANIPVDFDHSHVTTVKDLDDAILSIKRNQVGLKASIEVLDDDDIAPNQYIRRHLDLYLNIVHFKPFCNLDLVLMQQNTEGEFSMLEHQNVKGVVECLKIITRSNSERVARRTFEFARDNNRKKITVVHKANIMKMSDGLFLATAQNVGKQFPSIKLDDVIVDNLCMQLVSNPKQFDVLMTPSLYGTIVSNLLSGLLGGPGLFGSGNYGEKYALFEPAVRKRSKRLAGKNIANPTAILNASVKMLHHLGLTEHAAVLNIALYRALCDDKMHTQDLGGVHSTEDVVNSIKKHIYNVKMFESHLISNKNIEEYKKSLIILILTPFCIFDRKIKDIWVI